MIERSRLYKACQEENVAKHPGVTSVRLILNKVEMPAAVEQCRKYIWIPSVDENLYMIKVLHHILENKWL